MHNYWARLIVTTLAIFFAGATALGLVWAVATFLPMWGIGVLFALGISLVIAQELLDA